MRGLLALTLLALVVVGIIWMAKSGGENQPVKEIERLDNLKIEVTRTNMNALGKAIAAFVAAEGEIPESLEDLRKDIGIPSPSSLDAWGTAIKYERLTEDDFRLISAGKDKTFNTEDDIIINY
jgi:hypothetical protein